MQTPIIPAKLEKAKVNGRPEKCNGRIHRLTPLQERFVNEMVACGRLQLAAVRAGVDPKCAASMACQYMTLPRFAHVAEAVRAGLEENRERSKGSADRLIASMLAVLEFDPADLTDEDSRLLPVRKLPPEARLALEEMQIVTEVKQKPIDKGKFKKEIIRRLYPRKGADRVAAAKLLMLLWGLEPARKVNLKGQVVTASLSELIAAARSEADAKTAVAFRIAEKVAAAQAEQNGQ